MNFRTVSITVALLAGILSAGFYAFAEDPYRVWMNSQIASLTGSNKCPADWTAAKLSGHAPSWSSQYNGGGGIDSLINVHAGQVDLDGFQIASFEILDSRNDRPNVVTILLSGLITTELNEVLVAGDQRIDTVYLDRCLQWGFPKKLALTFDAPERWLMEGRDPDGQRYKVEITEGQRVKILPRQDVNDRLEAARHLAFKAIETRASD